jgi:hypothetical protein
MNTLKELAIRFEKIKEEMVATATSAVKLEFEKVFTAYPELTYVCWTQFTPYFNDGEECTFSVNSFAIGNAPDMDDVSAYGEYDGDEEGIWSDDYLSGEAREKYIKVYELQQFCESEIGEDVLRAAFGDHSVVTVTREGIDVQEYEHE